MSRRVTVVIPTYNRAKYLVEAVTTALRQNAVESEVIVVDDGSTDDTEAVVERLQTEWGDRVQYVRQENSERSVARNNGLQLATGGFVAFLDSDDRWRPDHLWECVTALEKHADAVASYSEYGLISEDGKSIRERQARPRRTGVHFLRAICLKRIILHPTEVVFRREALGAAPFDTEIPGAEDWLLFVQLAGRGRFIGTGQVTAEMRVHSGGTFGNPAKFSASLLKAAEKVIGTGIPASLGILEDRIRSINLAHCGYAYYLAGRRSDAWRMLFQAVRVWRLALGEPDWWRVAARLCVRPEMAAAIRRARYSGR